MIRQETRRKALNIARAFEGGHHQPKHRTKHHNHAQQQIAIGEEAAPPRRAEEPAQYVAHSVNRRLQQLEQRIEDARQAIAQSAQIRPRQAFRFIVFFLFQARALHANLYHRQHDQHRRHHQRGRRRQAIFAERTGETVVVDVMHDIQGRRTGSAAGEGEDHIKDLHRPYGRQDDDHQHRRRQQGQRDRPEGAPTARAVNRRRLVQIRRDRLQTGQQNQSVKAHQRPDADHHHPEARPVAVGQEAQFLPAQADDDRVEQAILLQHPAPDQRHHNRRQQHRIKEDAAKETAPPYLPVQHHRRHQGHADHHRHLRDHKTGGIQHGRGEKVLFTGGRAQKIVTLEEPLQIRRADVGPLIEKEFVAAGEGIGKIEEHGEKHKDRKNEHIGRDEDISHARHAGELLYAVEQPVK